MIIQLKSNDYDIVEIKVHALHAGVELIKDKGKSIQIILSPKRLKILMEKNCLNRRNLLVEQ